VERNEINYYYLRGPVLLFSAQEDVVRRAIDTEREAIVGQPPVAVRLRRLGVERALLALWLNPRAWDAEVNGRANKEDAGARTFALCWKALQDIALAVHLDRE